MPLSLNIAITATGSVAAIRTPNNRAGAIGQASQYISPAVTTAAEMMVPTIARTRMGSMSRRSSRQ